MINRDSLIEQLVRHESMRLFPYKDSVGKLTLGVGRCIEDIGISKDEAMLMLANDINRAQASCFRYDWYNTLSEVRQNVMLDMMFNLGPNRFAGFVDMISCLAKKDYEGAAVAMLDSKWANQVGARANELANMMRVG